MYKVFLAAVAGSMLVANTVSAQTYNLTVAGYSPGGLVSTTAVGMDAALSAAFPGSTVTYQTSSGGLANALLVSTGKVPLGMASDTELQVALEGKPPFKAPIKNLKMIFRPYTAGSRFQISHVIAGKDWVEKHGIKTFGDIVAKKPAMRIAVNRPGNMDGDVGIELMKAVGITQDNVKSWGGQVVRAASQEMTSLFLDRRLDVVIFGIAMKHPRVLEMEKGREIVMLPIDGAAAKKASDASGAPVCHVKAGEYAFLASDSASVCVGLMLIARDDMADETAYNVAKAMIENIAKYQGAHRLLKATATPERLVEAGAVPFHPGALKYYKEKGLIK